MKILIITNQLLYTCGVSKHLFYFLKESQKYTDHEFTILCSGGDAIDIYRSLVKEVCIWPWIKHENRSTWNFLKFLYRLFFLQTRNNFKIFHSHNHYAANIAKIISSITKVKTIQTVHGILDPVGRLKHYNAHYFISVNEHIKTFLIQGLKKNEAKIRLIRNGVPHCSMAVKNRNRKLKIIAGGRLTKIKGFDIYLRAVSDLPVEIKNKAEFFLVGKGEQKESLFALSKELNSGIIFLDEQKNLNELLLTTDIFINPSRSKNEGFPLIINEAAVAKNLIISSNFLGYDSILRDGENCLIFNVDSTQELVQLLIYAIENYLSLVHLTNKLYNLVLEEFNIEKMFEKTVNLYQEIVL